MDVPLGDGRLPLDLPTEAVTVAEPPGGEAVDPDSGAAAAMADTHGPALETLAADPEEVAIVVTDVTRSTPDRVLLGHLFEALETAGVEREAVTIVVGLGLHRPLSDRELRAEFGPYADLVINHDPDAVVTVGRVEGVPIEVHPAVAEADLVCSTGMVEPHQYAGFSGGAKTAVVGAGGEAAIRYTHGPELLGESGVRLGRIVENPFRTFIDRAGDVLGVDFCCNVTAGPAGVLGVSAGEPRAVVRDLATTARDALSVTVEREYDAVVAGVGAPKDATLYQASRAATYVALGDRNPLREGGRIVLPATLSEGAGEGRGERRFHDWLSRYDDSATLFEAMREGYEPGAQRAFVLARVLREHPVFVTNSTHPEVVEECLLTAVPTVADAIDPGSEVLVVPDALHTLLVD
jgi:nickel-dependent lactate racemase